MGLDQRVVRFCDNLRAPCVLRDKYFRVGASRKEWIVT